MLGEFKSFTNAVLNTSMLPDIGCHVDGFLYDKGLSVRSVDEFKKSVSKDYDSVFVKVDRSEQGKGVTMVPLANFSEENLRNFGNCVLQSPIDEHEFFKQMNPSSVQTVRITTVKENSGAVGVRAAYLRIGRKGSAWVRPAEAVKVAIVNDGCLSPFGFMPDWQRRECHPDTGFLFKGKHLPHFEKAREACVTLHGKVPHLTLIGWDIAIDREGQTKIIEWNTAHADIKFSEATTGPCFLGLGWEKYRRN